jgi:GxxExxY protein
MDDEKLIYKEESYLIQGSIFEVYKQLGSGFLESVYQECLEIEFRKRSVPFISQKEISILYKGQEINQYFKADFVCYEKIIIELKAVTELNDIHRAQLMNYLKATGFRLGLLVNFCAFPRVKIERIVL